MMTTETNAYSWLRNGSLSMVGSFGVLPPAADLLIPPPRQTMGIARRFLKGRFSRSEALSDMRASTSYAENSGDIGRARGQLYAAGDRSREAAAQSVQEDPRPKFRREL
jgi:hypothetical protein